MKKKYLFISVISLLLSFASISGVCFFRYNQVRYGFVNTEKLLNSFVESQKAMDELKKNEEDWLAKENVIKDSLTAFEHRINQLYEKMTVDEKKKVKQEQIEKIANLKKFREVKIESLKKMRNEKLQSVYTKINSAMSDFAVENHLDIVFASGNGSIIYGDGSTADLTEKFLIFLNKRFE